MHQINKNDDKLKTKDNTYIPDSTDDLGVAEEYDHKGQDEVITILDHCRLLCSRQTIGNTYIPDSTDDLGVSEEYDHEGQDEVIIISDHFVGYCASDKENDDKTNTYIPDSTDYLGVAEEDNHEGQNEAKGVDVCNVADLNICNTS